MGIRLCVSDLNLAAGSTCFRGGLIEGPLVDFHRWFGIGRQGLPLRGFLDLVLSDLLEKPFQDMLNLGPTGFTFRKEGIWGDSWAGFRRRLL
ncbi:MAG: hypothetical protein Q8P12_01910, partial [bacterium]|nr:hypothetical protein [bacterium]